jgi:hypothetical protein
MNARILGMALLTMCCGATASAWAQGLARTATVPPALADLQVASTAVLTADQAERVRGRALGEEGILQRMALIKQQALEPELSATNFVAGTGVVELPNQALSFNGYWSVTVF